MNGEKVDTQPPQPAKVEAPPIAEAPGVEKGTGTPGPLNPAEQNILGITGAPGDKRENPRGALQNLADLGGEKPPPTRDEIKSMMTFLNEPGGVSKASPGQLRTLAENTGYLTDSQMLGVLDKAGAPQGSKITIDRGGKQVEIPLDPYPDGISGGESYQRLNITLLDLEDQNHDNQDPNNPYAKARGEIAQAISDRLNFYADRNENNAKQDDKTSSTPGAEINQPTKKAPEPEAPTKPAATQTDTSTLGEAPAAPAQTEPAVSAGTQAESPNPPTPPETPAINNQDLLQAMSGNGDEATDNQPQEPLTETYTPETGSPSNDLSQKMSEIGGENAAIDIEAEAKQKAIEDINTILAESNVPADKQEEINNALNENPQAAPDVATEIKSINTTDKSETDAKIHALEEEVKQLKLKLEQGQQLTPEDQDKLTKGTLILAILAAIIGGTLEGLKKGIEQSAKL